MYETSDSASSSTPSSTGFLDNASAIVLPVPFIHRAQADVEVVEDGGGMSLRTPSGDDVEFVHGTNRSGFHFGQVNGDLSGDPEVGINMSNELKSCCQLIIVQMQQYEHYDNVV